VAEEDVEDVEALEEEEEGGIADPEMAQLKEEMKVDKHKMQEDPHHPEEAQGEVEVEVEEELATLQGPTMQAALHRKRPCLLLTFHSLSMMLVWLLCSRITVLKQHILSRTGMEEARVLDSLSLRMKVLRRLPLLPLRISKLKEESSSSRSLSLRTLLLVELKAKKLNLQHPRRRKLPQKRRRLKPRPKRIQIPHAKRKIN